ncbi:MAG: serine/threonine-protein phosphatase [Pirellulaceae bacterium]|nr:serine/threonine-protein phosphatase [Pirellulaceae bacterium]
MDDPSPRYEEDTLDFTLEQPSGSRFLGAPPVPVQVQFGAATHQGHVRSSNEDHYAVMRRRRTREVLLTNLDDDLVDLHDDVTFLMLVADGMGGAARGELASSLAIRAVWATEARFTTWVMLLNDDERPDMRERAETFAQLVNQALRDQAISDPKLAGMGTTMTAAYTIGDDAIIAHIGDSRAYHFDQGQLKQITVDHTVAQEMVDAGAAEEDVRGFRHILTNCLGGGSDQVSADVRFIKLADQDGLLLCSDGLTEHVTNAEIEAVLRQHAVPQVACDALVQLALDRGGKDNITVVLSRYTILKARPTN